VHGVAVVAVLYYRTTVAPGAVGRRAAAGEGGACYVCVQ